MARGFSEKKWRQFTSEHKNPVMSAYIRASGKGSEVMRHEFNERVSNEYRDVKDLHIAFFAAGVFNIAASFIPYFTVANLLMGSVFLGLSFSYKSTKGETKKSLLRCAREYQKTGTFKHY